MSTFSPFQRIDVEQAKQLLPKQPLVLDARDPQAFSQGHLANAELITRENLNQLISQTPKQQAVLIYCYHGKASQTYAQMFCDFGFKEVYSLDGGYTAWSQQPPTVRIRYV
jgi:rhodanese-related sulfurtransferase